MTKQEFLTKIGQEQLDLGSMEIETEYLTNSPYVLGCYYDENMRKWRIYETFERGGHSIIREYDNENQAFDDFDYYVHKEVETRAKIKEQHRRGDRL